MARAPVDGPLVVTPHGAYDFPRSTRRHHGLDIRTTRSTIIKAPEAMRVLVVLRGGRSNRTAPNRGALTRARDPRVAGVGLDGYGPDAVLAVGASGVVHVLGHLDGAPDVGQELAEGDPVGRGSRVGHTHWEVRKPDKAPWPRDRRGEDTWDPGAWLWAMDHLAHGPTAPTPSRATAIVTRATAIVRDAVVASYLEQGAIVLGLWWLLAGRRRR